MDDDTPMEIRGGGGNGGDDEGNDEDEPQHVQHNNNEDSGGDNVQLQTQKGVESQPKLNPKRSKKYLRRMAMNKNYKKKSSNKKKISSNKKKKTPKKEEVAKEIAMRKSPPESSLQCTPTNTKRPPPSAISIGTATKDCTITSINPITASTSKKRQYIDTTCSPLLSPVSQFDRNLQIMSTPEKHKNIERLLSLASKHTPLPQQTCNSPDITSIQRKIETAATPLRDDIFSAVKHSHWKKQRVGAKLSSNLPSSTDPVDHNAFHNYHPNYRDIGIVSNNVVCMVSIILRNIM